jgi:hypothetical protein
MLLFSTFSEIHFRISPDISINNNNNNNNNNNHYFNENNNSSPKSSSAINSFPISSSPISSSPKILPQKSSPEMIQKSLPATLPLDSNFLVPIKKLVLTYKEEGSPEQRKFTDQMVSNRVMRLVDPNRFVQVTYRDRNQMVVWKNPLWKASVLDLMQNGVKFDNKIYSFLGFSANGARHNQHYYFLEGNDYTVESLIDKLGIQIILSSVLLRTIYLYKFSNFYILLLIFFVFERSIHCHDFKEYLR